MSAMVLVALAAFVLVTRLATFQLPPNVDLHLYQTIGHRLLAGDLLYTEQWDHKPPGIFLAYAGAELIAGLGPAQYLLLGSLLSIGTLAACYIAGSALSTGAGLAAAGAWTLIQADILTESHQPNGEAFVVLCVAWAFALLVRKRSTGWGAGLLWALATLFKPNAIVFPATLALVWLASARDRRSAGADVARWVTVGAAVWLLHLAYFAALGRLDDFTGAVFAYGRFYAVTGWVSLIRSLQPQTLVPGFLVSFLPLASLAAIGLLLSDRGRRWGLWLGLLVASWLAVWSPGYFYRHYYQFYGPVVAIGAGWGLASIWRRGRRIAVGAGAAAGFLVLTVQIALFADPPIEDRYVQDRAVAASLARVIEPGETLYQVGSETGYYLATGTEPPVGVHFLKHMAAGPEAGRLTRMVMDSLRADPPQYVVVDRYYASLYPEHPIHDWVRRNYRPAPDLGAYERASVYVLRQQVRRDGDSSAGGEAYEGLEKRPAAP